MAGLTVHRDGRLAQVGASSRTRPVLFRTLWLFLISGCGSQPAGPAPVPQPSGLPAGRYVLSASSGGFVSSCTGSLDSWGVFGPSVGAFVTVAPDADGWIARAESSRDGDLTLHLRKSSAGSGGDLTVSGIASGTLFHALDRLSASPRNVTFGGNNPGMPANLDLTLSPNVAGSPTVGIATGRMTFTDSSGGTVACSSVSVILGNP
jgi:hypothetical protein